MLQVDSGNRNTAVQRYGQYPVGQTARIPRSYQLSGRTERRVRPDHGATGGGYAAFVMREAPKRTIRTMREARATAGYRAELNRSNTRDGVNAAHMGKMSGALTDLRSAPDEESGYIMRYLNKLLHDHTSFLSSSRYAALSWAGEETGGPSAVQADEAEGESQQPSGTAERDTIQPQRQDDPYPQRQEAGPVQTAYAAGSAFT